MKLSVVSSILGGVSLDESLAYLSGLGVDEFELGVGGYPGKAHADAIALSKDKDARKKLLDTFAKHNMGISALSVHGNCVHPDKADGGEIPGGFRGGVRARGADRHRQASSPFPAVPGSDRRRERQPTWVTCCLAARISAAVSDWQWNEVLIPYWKKAVKFAADQRREAHRARNAPGILRV